jgi:hypothetical protein
MFYFSIGTSSKKTVDEIIFRTSKPRNRLMPELMTIGGMRINEVLKLTLPCWPCSGDHVDKKKKPSITDLSQELKITSSLTVLFN